MKLRIFTDKSIVEQETVTIQLDRDGNKAEGISLMIAKPEHGAGVVEILLPKAELLKALEVVAGDKAVPATHYEALKDECIKRVVQNSKFICVMRDALDHLDRGNDINAMGLLRKTLRELS